MTHRLADLDIAGRDLVLAHVPAFDFHAIRSIARFTYELDADQLGVLTCVFLCEAGADTYELLIRFEGVRRLVLPELAPRAWISELEINDVSRDQLEGIRFEAIACLDQTFRCACRSLAIVAFQPSG